MAIGRRGGRQLIRRDPSWTTDNLSDSDSSPPAPSTPKNPIVFQGPIPSIRKSSSKLKRATGFSSRLKDEEALTTNTQTSHSASAYSNNEDRWDLQHEFMDHVLSWDLAKDDTDRSPMQLRNSFAHVDDYVSMFTSLLFEDLRANLVSGLEENSRHITRAPLSFTQTSDIVTPTATVRAKLIFSGEISAKDFIQLTFDNDRTIIAYVVDSCTSHSDSQWKLLTLRIRLPRPEIIYADQSSVMAVLLGTSITSSREFVALKSCATSRLLPFLLQPTADRGDGNSAPIDLPDPAWDQVPTLLMQRLEQDLNPDQLEAVKQCAAFRSPFSLIQGPPGTGKTKTVLHLLNVLHLSMYQRHYLSVIAASLRSLQRDSPPSTAPSLKMDYSDVASSSVPLSDAFEFIAQSHLTPSSSSGPFQILPRPRILVCAPSNAAVDEIVGRLAVERLLDGNGLPYTPDIVRIGRPSSIRDGAVKDNISLDHLVDAFFRYSPAQLKERMILVDQHRKRVGMNLKKMQDYVLHVRATSTPCDLNALAVQITSFAEERYRIGLEYQRLEMVRDNRKEVANARLQESFLDQAQIVFSTLSGTQSRFLAGSGSQRGFDVCIIDECAQCVEASTLLPLVGYGDIRVVILVGDPRQLPATVFMTGNRARIYQRSMFQRLQEAGLPSIMLTQQYRMHPEIRQFPSRYFYSNSLRDGGQTLLYSPDYYTDRRFGPYLFFDLTGRELRQRSVRNATEAAFIAQHIDALITSFPAVNPNTIAVVTPYLSQVACVKGALRSLTPPLDDVVEVTTIDSFQGREKDIVLFSCVRSGSGEIGFVKDVRRMNVGITRARHAMWIVGNAATLQLSKPWAALIDDARRRKLYISS